MRLRGRLTLAGGAAFVALAVAAFWPVSVDPQPAHPTLRPLDVTPMASAVTPAAPRSEAAPARPAANALALPADALAAPTSRSDLAKLAERDGAFERTVQAAGEDVLLRYTLDPRLTRDIW